MDHGRQKKDGASLAGAGSEAVQTCSEGSPTSYHGYASCPSRCGCCLLRVCFACRFPSSRGVTRSRTASLGSIQIGTLGGSTVYPILSSSTLLQSLTMSCRDLSTRIFLLTKSGPDILLIHCRSSAASEAEWSMRCRFQRWFQIHSSSAFWRASRPIIACLTINRFQGGGLGVIVHRSNNSVLFYNFFYFIFVVFL